MILNLELNKTEHCQAGGNPWHEWPGAEHAQQDRFWHFYSSACSLWSMPKVTVVWLFFFLWICWRKTHASSCSQSSILGLFSSFRSKFRKILWSTIWQLHKTTPWKQRTIAQMSVTDKTATSALSGICTYHRAGARGRTGLNPCEAQVLPSLPIGCWA